MKKLATFAAILLLVGCASAPEMKMTSAGDYESIVKEAQASIKKAASVGGEWRDSKKFLKNAAKAAKAGDMKKALKLAMQAKSEGDIGYAQAMEQKKAKPWLF